MANPNSQKFQSIVNLLHNSTSDTEKFAALMMVPKLLTASDIAPEERAVLYEAISSKFLIRLLKTDKFPEDCPQHLYKSCALSILVSFASDSSVIKRKDYLEVIPHLDQILIWNSGADSDAALMVSDACLVLRGVSETVEGCQALADSAVPGALCAAVVQSGKDSHSSRAEAEALLEDLLRRCGSALWHHEASRPGLRLLLEDLSSQLQAAGDARLGVCSRLAKFLASLDQGAIAGSENMKWSQNIRTALFELLQNKLGAHQRQDCLLMAVRMLELLGVAWALPEVTQPRFLLLLTHLACVEIRVQLESHEPHALETSASLVCGCYSLVERIIAHLSAGDSLQLDSEQTVKLHAALVGAFNAVMHFLSAAANEEREVDEVFLLASVRVLGAWLAEETTALRAEVYAVLPFLLSVCQRQFAAQGVDVLQFLVAGLSHLSAEDTPRKVLVKHEAYVLLAEYLKRLVADLPGSGASVQQRICGVCGVLLNFCVTEPQLIASHPVFKDLLSLATSSIQATRTEGSDLLVNFNLLVMTLIIARRNVDELRSCVTLLPHTSALLCGALELAPGATACQLRSQYRECWEDLHELWFLAAQNASAVCCDCPWVAPSVLQTQELQAVLDILRTSKGKGLPVDMRESLAELLTSLVSVSRKARDVISSALPSDVRRSCGLTELDKLLHMA